MSPERNAVLAIVAKRGAWHIADHVAAEPGHDQGKDLRERLIVPLTIAADRAGVEIRTVAANQKLADQYVADVPGLVALHKRGCRWGVIGDGASVPG